MEKESFKREKEALGYRIRELRSKVINPDTKRYISQEELSLRTGHAKKTVGEIERGNTNPRYETLLLLSKELNVSINELFNFDMNEYKKLLNKSKRR